MNSFDNIRHDISDASFSVTTAIELLSGMEQDGGDNGVALHELVARLERIRQELETIGRQVAEAEH